MPHLFAILVLVCSAAFVDAAAIPPASAALPPSAPAMQAWVAELLERLVPPAVAARVPPFPGWSEPAEARRLRYQTIAADVAAVVLDPNEPPAYLGPRGRERTAALLVAIAFYETRFALDADRGPCYRGPRHRERCGGGRSASMWQIELGRGRTPEGWSQADLFADRQKAIRRALRLVRMSFGACRQRGPTAALNGYVSGRCDVGDDVAALRLRLAARLGTMPTTPR